MIFLVLGLVMLIGCAGEENVAVDTDPPEKPHLIDHLGDLGDIDEDTGTYSITDNNNGIDAVSNGNRIKIQWEPFYDNSDIELIKVYRYQESATGIDTVLLVDNISYELDYDKDYYIDGFNSISNPLEIRWFYFIELYDAAGNFSISDTVDYKLAYKSNLVRPQVEEHFTIQDSIRFEWDQGDYEKYRLLIFDSQHNLYKEPVDLYFDNTEDFIVDYAPFNQGEYYWRVDAFGAGENFGSESEERVFYVDFEIN